MKVITYSRVSSKEQMKGDSIEAQEKRLKQFCLDNQYEVVQSLSDGGKSASFNEDKKIIKLRGTNLVGEFNLNKRPSFQKIIEGAGEGSFEAVIFFKWDRAFRDAIFAKLTQQFLESKGIKMIPTDDSRDPLTSSIMQILSEEEIRKSKERVRSTRLLRFEEGRMVGRAPFGYIFDPRRKMMNVDKKKSKIVQRAFEMTIEGIDYKIICKELKIPAQSYYNIIRNKVYIGLVEFEGQIRQGVHEPLITKEMFEKVKNNI